MYIQNIKTKASNVSNNLQGLLWALAATALFAIVLAMVKSAVIDFHVLQILFIRQLVVFISVLPSLARDFPQNLKTQRPFAHMIRLAGAFVALSTGIWAVALLPLTTATTLAFSQVFFVALLASKFLGEPVGIHRISAISIGFIGVIVAMRPGLDGVATVNSLIPIIGAFGAALAVICVRKLSQSDSTATLLAYQSVAVGVLSGVPLFWLWVTPNLSQLALLVGIGLLATIAQWVGVKALRMGEASVVGNIEYTKLIYAAVLGYLAFSEVPDAYTITGAAIIIGSSIYLFRREVLNRSRAA